MFVANLELHFIGKQAGRVAEMIDEVMDEMLAHPFFGRQSHIFATENIENRHTTLVFLYLYFVWGKV